jgi:large subunit ribosomal protein L6
MSRVGKYPVPVPSGVQAHVAGSVITVKGPKGELTRKLHPDMAVEVGEGSVTVKRPSDSKTHKSLHGLTRTLIANMVHGVSQGSKRSSRSRESSTAPSSRARRSC